MIVALLCAIFFRLGGVGTNDRFLFFLPPPTRMGNKWFRWLGIGLLISAVTGNWLYIPAYFVATNVIGYGESHPITKVVGKYTSWVIYGLCFGLASFSILNAFISSVVFFALMYLSNKGIKGWKLDHSIVEFLFPLVTIGGQLC